MYYVKNKISLRSGNTIRLLGCSWFSYSGIGRRVVQDRDVKVHIVGFRHALRKKSAPKAI